MANEHNFVFCATDWSGMSTQDVPNIATILGDLSNFASLPDRAQQGFVNFMYLGRLLIHPAGFNTNTAFQFVKAGQPQAVIDPARLFYDGNSQGGIMGGSLAALAPDFNRAVLGVPAMNYSTLLRRSVDFDQYAVVLYQNYPNELERPLILSLIQTLWDRGEANGYAHHMTSDPLPNTPPHEVLLHEAFGDHQVANVATEVEARTIGAALRTPAMDPGRHSDVNPFYGIPPIGAYPYDGSALVVWDSGQPTPPANNTPPRAGSDPHSHPRNYGDRPRPEVGVPEDRRRRGRHLRRRAVLRQRLHRAMTVLARTHRRWAIPLAILVTAAALAAAAGASHQPAELISTGPSGGNGPLTAAYAGSSTDGERVFFETLERLVAADTDNRNDVYENASGATSLVSTGPAGGNGSVDAFFYGASADGASVLFGTSERLTAADTDSAPDVYERAGGATTLVSTGSTGGNGPQGAFFDGVSVDGARVFFHTAERLTAADTDSQADVYERSGGATALVSIGSTGGNGAFPAFFDGASADGTRVFFDTDERLESADTDSVQDVYERTGGTTSLVSIGPDGGNGPSPAYFDAASEDGMRVILSTDEVLTRAGRGRAIRRVPSRRRDDQRAVRHGRFRERRLRRPLHG